MPTPLSRLVLIVFAVIYAVLGLAFLLVTSQAVVFMLPISAATPAALTEITAMYGGLELALAVIFAWGAWRPRYRRTALIFAAVTFAGLALGRSVGMLRFSPVDPYHIGIDVLEYIGLLFSLLGLWKARAELARA